MTLMMWPDRPHVCRNVAALASTRVVEVYEQSADVLNRTGCAVCFVIYYKTLLYVGTTVVRVQTLDTVVCV